MKLMKKISAVLLSLCLLVPCFSMVALAADGRISFTDPSTSVGEYVEVKCVLRSTSGNMGDIEVALTYDESYLRFESGDGIETTGSGALTCSGSASAAEVSFVAKFQALQEGTTKIEISGATVEDENGATLTLDQGNSTVTIAEGDPSKITDGGSDVEGSTDAVDQQIEVNGVSYTLTDDFADADIPNGYARTQRTLDGVERQMVENESGNICLGYMKDAEDNGDFFLYNEESATFAPYAEISISDTTSIVVLSDASQVSLPDTYREAKLTLNEKEFPVWQDTAKEGLYVIYAMNNSGETGYYQYDSKEGTYQRIEPVTSAPLEESEAPAPADTSSFVGKVLAFVQANLMMVIFAIAAVLFVGLIILIVLAVKLHNRNAEIDELYDEYGIDLEEEEEKPAKKEKETKKNRKQKKAEPEEEFFAEEDFAEEDFVEEDFMEEDFAEEDFAEGDFTEEDFAEEDFVEEDFMEEDFAEEDFTEDFEEAFEDYREPQRRTSRYAEPVEEEFTGFTERMDFTIDDLDELLEEKSEKKRGHVELDDTFKMDFIDLD